MEESNFFLSHVLHFFVSCFHSLNFMDTQSLPCDLFYKPGCRTEAESLQNRRLFWQNKPSEQPQCFPELLLGVVALSTEVCGSRASGSCSGKPSGGQRSGLAGTWSSDPAALGAQCWSDAAPATRLFCGVIPSFLCPCIYQEGDSSSKVFDSSPLSARSDMRTGFLIREKVASPSAF